MTTPDSGLTHYAPFVLPGSRSVLLNIRSAGAPLETAQFGVLDVASGRIDTLGIGTRAVYSDGYLLYPGSDGTLLAQPFDLRARETRGQAVAILDGLVLHGNTTHEVTPSRTGSLAVQRSVSGPAGRDLLFIDGSDGRQRIERPGRSSAELEDPAFGPGGRRIALTIGSGGGAPADVWMLDRQQGTLERFTVGGGFQAVWSPDGSTVAVGKTDGIYVKRADGTGDDQLVGCRTIGQSCFRQATVRARSRISASSRSVIRFRGGSCRRSSSIAIRRFRTTGAGLRIRPLEPGDRKCTCSR
jgi:hypothetical protein